MGSESLVLTLDLGTSGPKVSLFNARLERIDTAFREVPLIHIGNQGVEQDPRAWIQALNEGIEEMRSRNGDRFKHIVAINSTAQWSGTVPMDSNGNPIGNAIIWMDARGAPYAQKLMDGLIKVDGYALFKTLQWIRITGGCPTRSGKDSIAHILFLKHERPEIYAATRTFLEPKDYLNFHLTGLTCASEDSMTVHWLTDTRSIHSITYSKTLIQQSGIDPEKLPKMVKVNSILGCIRPELAKQWGLSPEVQVISGTPDVHSAAVGSGGAEDFVPHLYIGTSSWLVCHVPFKKTDLLHNMASIPSGIPGRYMLVNEQETSGACLQFLKNQIFFPPDSVHSSGSKTTMDSRDVYPRMDQLASLAPPGSEGLMFLPWLNGERSPVDQNHLRGGWINLSMKHEQKHLIRAVMEGVALNSRWLMDHCESFCGRKFESIRLIGGGALSSVWCQIIADTFNKPIKRLKDPQSANSLGVAALAWVALNKLKIEDLAQRIEISETLEPNPANRELYDRNYRHFRSFHQTHEPFLKKLKSGGSP